MSMPLRSFTVAPSVITSERGADLYGKLNIKRVWRGNPTKYRYSVGTVNLSALKTEEGFGKQQ